MPLTRREFLVGAATAAAALAACSGDDADEAGDAAPGSTTTSGPGERTTTTPPVPELPGEPFTLGVASGDPDASSVVLWTRLAVDGMPQEAVPVVWEVAADDSFAAVVASGLVSAEPRFGHSVHAVAGGLDAGTEYRYRFRAGDFTSPVGTTRTAPASGGESLTFAFGSCQHYEAGFWPAHTHLAEEAVDLVVWLGDYIYEGAAAPGGVRRHDGPEPTTLEAYRARYALYKADPALQAAHASAPWLVVWDDHEVENNYAGDRPEDAGPAAAFLDRRAAAYQAWWEHMPVRLDPPDGPTLAINRTLRWGELATIFALDTRQHRDDQPCGRPSDLGESCPDREDPARTILGADQLDWLAGELPASPSTWNVLANQVIFTPAPIPVGASTVFNLDQWDGYPAERDRVLELLAGAANPVIITGDIHASAVTDVRRGDAVVATEFIGTSISSTFPAGFIDLYERGAQAVGAKMADATHRGYVVCRVTPSSFVADYRIVESATVESSPISTSSSWRVDAGTPGVRPA